MTRRELSRRLLQMGFKLVKETNESDEYICDGFTVIVYEYLSVTNWYIGKEKQTRQSEHKSFIWKTKRFMSRAYNWSEFEEVIEKQIKDGKFVYQSVNDQSVQQGRVLSDEAEESIC